MENKFYIFGSEDSKDYDVLVAVDNISTNADENAQICKHYNEVLKQYLPDKPINSNLGIISSIVLAVAKGTPDEVNNSLHYTYEKHKQFHPNPIEIAVSRDVDEKIIRVARFILSFFSRHEDIRFYVKNAMKGDLNDRILALNLIDFQKYTSFPNKKEKIEDIYKVVAFQFGQVFSLINNQEAKSYTKTDIISNYPDLEKFIHRKELSFEDLGILNRYLKEYISYVSKRLLKGNISLEEKFLERKQYLVMENPCSEIDLHSEFVQ